MNKPYERRAFVKQLATFSLGAPFSLAQQSALSSNAAQKGKRHLKSDDLDTEGKFEEKIAKAAAAGIQSVELVSEHEGWSDAEAAKNKSLVESYGMRIDTFVGSHDWSKRPVSMVNPAHREAFLADVKHAIAWAKKLDTPQIILMSGNEQPGLTHEAQFESLVEAGKQAVELAHAADLTLIFENLNSKVNHPGYFLD